LRVVYHYRGMDDTAYCRALSAKSDLEERGAAI